MHSNFKKVDSGNVSFKIDRSYELIESGRKDHPKPLIVYLHGYRQALKDFREQCQGFLQAEAFHLFIQAPYPVYDKSGNKPVEQWGSAWYLYDGNQEQFISSLEKTSQFLIEIIKKKNRVYNCNRITVFGYSMGGYLAGYLALTHPELIHDLIVYGCRLKTEIVSDYHSHHHQRILAVHGERDKYVDSMAQKKEIEYLREQQLDAAFISVQETHAFSSKIVSYILPWLADKDYIL